MRICKKVVEVWGAVAWAAVAVWEVAVAKVWVAAVAWVAAWVRVLVVSVCALTALPKCPTRGEYPVFR